MAENPVDAALARLNPEDSSIDVKARLDAAVSFRDNIDPWSQSGWFIPRLPTIVPTLLGLLEGEPVFTSTAPEQRLRNCVLEILHRFPSSPPDQLAQYAPKIVEKLMVLLETENEDNATLCIKTIMDLHRHHPKLLQDNVQPFLDIIQKMFETIEQVVKDTFQTSNQTTTAASAVGSISGSQYSQSPKPGSPATSSVVTASDSTGESQQTRELPKGMKSFKVLTECPIVVVSVFQAYHRGDIVNNNVKTFVPLIKGILMLQAPPQEKAHADAAANGTTQIGVCKDIKNKVAFAEFITAQVKTMSFLAYLLRAYGQQLQDFLPTLPDIVVRLLRDCPKEKCSIRKELLVAIRHIINFNFRKIFLKSIDELLDQRTLLGDGLTVHETLRPLAYSLLADLIHHVRDSLTLSQIRTTVQVYTRNLRDPFPGTSFQSMSAKLLLNMAECIAKLDDKKQARYFLIAILDAIGQKFGAMNLQYANAVKVSAQYDPQSSDNYPEDLLADKDHPPDWDEFDIFTSAPIKAANPRDRSLDPVTDNKFLFKNLVQGLKNVFYQLRACNPPISIDSANAPPNWSEVANGFTAEEVQVLIKLFHEGIRMFQYYDCEKWPKEGKASLADLLGNHHVSCDKDEKELLETFATIFHHVDPATFHEAFHSEIPHIYEMMFTHPAVLHIPQFLLASEATSPAFAGMLLQFLMGRIEDVGSSDVIKASILLRFFKLSFMAVTLFSQHNEQVLLPHVNKLVTQSIKLSTTTESPMHYFMLLRSLFRSIGGGRFEYLYKEILPLLEMLLEVLNNLILAARKTEERDLYVELSLTVPARLSNLLPHLSYLMRPLVLALRAGSELVGQGLRTLELCVDNLTADYLDPIMAPVIDDLMTALWDHLKPAPYSHFHAHTTMRILGKLGGRNRRFIDGPPKLNYERFSDSLSKFDIELIGAPNTSTLAANLGINTAIAKLSESPRSSAAKLNDVFYKRQALQLIIAQIKLMMGTENLPEAFAQAVRLQANDLYDEDYSHGVQETLAKDRSSSIIKRDTEQDKLKELLKACMTACSISDLKAESTAFIENISRHFTILDLGKTLADTKNEQKDFSPDAGEGKVMIDHRILVNAIVESLSSDNIAVREAAETAFLTTYKTAILLFGSKTRVHKLPFFTHFLNICAHSCYAEEWFTKAGGCLGISILGSKVELGDTWLAERQLEICRALMYAAKDLPENLPEATRVHALDTMDSIIRNCNKSASKDELANTSSPLVQLCAFLVFELAHTSRHVREAAQTSLNVLAEISKTEVHELVAPVRPRFLSQIFSKPLRALPFAIQIGYIEAMSFCLKLKSNLLESNEQHMSRFLRETIQLAEQGDEDNLFSPKTPTDQRNSDSVIRLKVSCLKLLSLALDFPDFANDAPNRGKPKVISVFFKSLYNKSTEVVDAANDAIKVVLEKDPKLPKDVLQSGLRPILVSLQDPSKLRIEGLSCLARLLQLLKNYFKVEIGQRLLDNIKAFADPVTLQRASFMLIEQHEKIRTVVAILNVFHLLPPAANSFMTTLVTRVLELEQQLRRTQYSPLREPIIKYVNRYPGDAWKGLFKPQLADHTKGRFFAQLLEDKDSGPLRAAVLDDIQGLVDAFSNEASDTEKMFTIMNTASITNAICKFPKTRQTLLQNEQFRTMLIESGKHLEKYLQGDNVDTGIRLATEQATKQIMDTIMSYLSMSPQDLDCFFEIVDATTSKTLPETPALYHFIYNHIVSSTSVDYWRKVVNRCIDIYVVKSSSEALKAFVIRCVLNPILSMDVMRNWDDLMGQAKGTELVNKSLAETFQNKLWKPQSNIDPTDESMPPGIDHSRMELLQMTAILLKYYHRLVQDSRKDVIRLGWTYIRLEDIINKHAAYVVLTYFIHYFDTPSKIASQVYMSLMRAHVPEGRSLVIQALEILAPVIPTRLGPTAQDSKTPPWAQYARRPIAEDPSNLQQLLCIFQFVSRHPDLFYDAKESLSQIIVSSIYKIASPPSPSLESKKMVLQVISLIWTWEQRYAAESRGQRGSISPSTGKRHSDGSPVNGEAPRNRSFIPSTSTRLNLIKYLFHLISNLSDRYPLPSTKPKETGHQQAVQASQSSDVCKKAIGLFYNLLSPDYWSDLDLSSLITKVLEPTLTSDPKEEKLDMGPTRIVNTLQLLSVVVNVKSDEWIAEQLPQLQRLLEKPIRNPNSEFQDCLFADVDADNKEMSRVPIVERILVAVPAESADEDAMEVDAPVSQFPTFLSTVISETLGAGNNVPGVNTLMALLKIRPQDTDQHLNSIMKSLNQILKEHLTPQGQQGQNQQAGQDPQTAETNVTMILKINELLAARIASLGDNRRPYLQSLTTLIEKSPNEKICTMILELTRSWIFGPAQAFPTLKEKTAVVHKMMSFETRPDQTLFNKFLDIIINVYEDKTITRTELAIRLEHAFLIGTRTNNIEMRKRFMSLFDRHLTKTASKRLLYLLASQNWEPLADSFWISQIIELLFGSIDVESVISLAPEDFKTVNASKLFGTYSQDERIGDVMLDEDYESFMADYKAFNNDLRDVRAKNILKPLCYLQHNNSELARQIWNTVFPTFWAVLTKEERGELQTGTITLLTREYHNRQIEKRPNCVKTMLEGVARTENPRMNFPHHLMKFLARTFDAWYVAMTFMEKSADEPIINTPAVRESNLDALAEVYAGLQEDDLFYGLWRKRCQFLDTTTALSYEQHGNWEKAQRMFEHATFKARTGAVPFTQSEYMLWEDHWVFCAQKLQQWDILGDFAKNDNLNDLYLDSIWRNLEWWGNNEHRKQLDQIIKGVSDAPTPRRAFFQSFMSLLKYHADQETVQNFTRACDDAVQLSIRKWHQLPRRITDAHVPILQNFQQLVELHDASVICSSLQQTNQSNLEHKSPELKLLLVTWRDRLPNFWDDINAWQDLVTWRQHIFQLINSKYLSLIPSQQTNVAGTSFAFRGYHETAWIINRFAHVARKHNLPDVCINQLSRIYTLPNIEIQEAFLKLREQAKCHYQNSGELQTGLDVINNTNLNYFGPQQKAEFYTLKGMFLAKQNQTDEANEAFGSALYFDLKLPKAWAEWARYNDKLFKDDPADMSKAAAAISCYLEAAGTYKNGKSRKLLSRVLWLLSLDDSEGTLLNTFDEFKGETPVWYWITFIPQLITSLSRPEATVARAILQKLAKSYPQSLYFQLRTSREEMVNVKKQQEAKANQNTRGKQGSPVVKHGSPESRPNTSDGRADSASRPATANGDTEANGATSGDSAGVPPTTPKQEPKDEQGTEGTPAPSQSQQPATPKKAWDYIDEISSVLKTAYPLLALSMETMTETISRNFKCTPDEDAYRLIGALLNDVLGYVSRSPQYYSMESKLPANTESHISRFAESVLPHHIRKSFEAEFVTQKPSTFEYIQKLRKWRDRFEDKIDRRAAQNYLESYGPHLFEFKFQKFDEIDVPGQYLLHKDNSKDFIQIERFLPEVDLSRGVGVCHRRLKIRGHDGSIHNFAIQHPSSRTSRKEERMSQLFRFFNDILGKRKESRRRKLQFTLPVMIPCVPALRMVQDDPSYITLQGIWEDYCRRKGISKDEPFLFQTQRLRELKPGTNEAAAQIRLQTFEAIQAKFMPKDIALNYFADIYPAFSDFWLFRRQFSYQLAALSFLTYTLLIRDRNPSRMFISRASGNIWGAELAPQMLLNKPIFNSQEPVPFRLTPNLQMLMGTLATEGIFSPALLVIAKALTELESKLEGQLSIFIRDEVYGFYSQQQRPGSSQQIAGGSGSQQGGTPNANASQNSQGGAVVTTTQLREAVQSNSDTIVKRAIAMAKAPEGNLPANQTVIDMVSKAVNPAKLAQSDALWMPWM